MDETVLAERVEMVEETVRAFVTLPMRMEAVEGRMSSVEGRLTSVEGCLTWSRTVSDPSTRDLAGRVQIVQLRRISRCRVSSSRSETRRDLHALHAVTTERFDALYERGEDTRRYMRVLHEEVLERIVRMGEDRR